MKINHKILSIPPYISTSWKNVLSIHVTQQEQNLLLSIILLNGSVIEISQLEQPVIDAIFAAHEKFLEQDQTSPTPKNFPPSITNNTNQSTAPSNAPSVIGFPIKFGIEGMDNFGPLLQHNSEAASSPDLPKEVLEKIAGLSKIVGFESGDSLPKPEPHCNCMHCQILRAIHNTEALPSVENEEELVTESDLKFRDWDIEQTSEKLYLVKNPLNSEEHYNVYLGQPLGCTCGENSCEHIRAVLNS